MTRYHPLHMDTVIAELQLLSDLGFKLSPLASSVLNGEVYRSSSLHKSMVMPLSSSVISWDVGLSSESPSHGEEIHLDEIIDLGVGNKRDFNKLKDLGVSIVGKSVKILKPFEREYKGAGYSFSWTADMYNYIGKRGTVKEFLKDGSVRIDFGNTIYRFVGNTEFLAF